MCFLKSGLGELNNCHGESWVLSLFKMSLQVLETLLLISLWRETHWELLSRGDEGNEASPSPRLVGGGLQQGWRLVPEGGHPASEFL